MAYTSLPVFTLCLAGRVLYPYCASGALATDNLHILLSSGLGLITWRELEQN